MLHDIRKVLARRWPMARVIVGACQVQGQGAAPTIVAALRRLSRWTDAETGRGVDLVILARGGGSLEDLWPFNEEIVVRAVAASPCPIVVGVGHETDVTLAEFAADVRAATPSVAAELAVPARADELARLRNLRGRLDRRGGAALRERRQVFDSERRALDGFRPAAFLAAERETRRPAAGPGDAPDRRPAGASTDRPGAARPSGCRLLRAARSGRPARTSSGPAPGFGAQPVRDPGARLRHRARRARAASSGRPTRWMSATVWPFDCTAGGWTPASRAWRDSPDD